MAKYNLNNSPNPFNFPDTYFLPKYTGHIQNYKHGLGQTIGRTSYLTIAKKPEMAGALSSCRKHPHPSTMSCDEEKMKEEDLVILKDRQPKTKYFLDGTSFIPGYTGYIPRTRFVLGESYHKTCTKGIAEMERIQKGEQNQLVHVYLKMENCSHRN